MNWIEKLAREHGTGGWQTLDDMVRFGRAVADAEREAIVALAASQGWAMKNEDPFEDAVREICDMQKRSNA